jgi:hypothetical protein
MSPQPPVDLDKLVSDFLRVEYPNSPGERPTVSWSPATEDFVTLIFFHDDGPGNTLFNLYSVCVSSWREWKGDVKDTSWFGPRYELWVDELRDIWNLAIQVGLIDAVTALGSIVTEDES